MFQLFVRNFQVRKLILVPGLYNGDVLESFEKLRFQIKSEDRL